MNIHYKTGTIPAAQDIIQLYDHAPLKRPTDNPTRIANMYAHSDVVVSAWDGEQLIGVARSLTDFHFSCYLSDLAVNPDYQGAGIGRQLIALTQEAIGPQCMLLLLSVPTAMEYYPKVGFTKADNAFYIPRQE